MMLNWNGERKYLCLVPDLRGKVSSISLLRMMLTLGFFVDVLYQIKEIFLHSCIFESF